MSEEARLPRPKLYRQLVQGRRVFHVPFEWFILCVLVFIWIAFVFLTLSSLIAALMITGALYLFGLWLVKRDPDFIQVWKIYFLHRRTKKGGRNNIYYP